MNDKEAKIRTLPGYLSHEFDGKRWWITFAPAAGLDREGDIIHDEIFDEDLENVQRFRVALQAQQDRLQGEDGGKGMISEKYLVKLSALIAELETSSNKCDRMAQLILLVLRSANHAGELPSLYDAVSAFASGAIERITKEGDAG